MSKKALNWFKNLKSGNKVLIALITAAALGMPISALQMAVTDEPVDSTNMAVDQKPKNSVVSYEEENDVTNIPFKEETIEDDELAKGKTEVRQLGVNGQRTTTEKITLTDGVETDREVINEKVTKEPVNQITAIGTYVAPKPKPKPQKSCDSNYSGACVPIAYDVDCGSGSGNGPEYVYSVVTVVGSDIYDLDRDGDGYGCD